MKIKWSFDNYEGYSNKDMLIGDYNNIRFVGSFYNNLLSLWLCKQIIILKFKIMINE